MANLFGTDLGINMPSFNFGDTYTVLLVGSIIFLVVLIGSIIIYLWYMNKMFYLKAVHYEYIGGATHPQRVFEDTARLIKVGDGGEQILFLRKKKEFRTAYGKKMAPNEYWFAKGQDGYWYNSVMGDLDAKMGVLDIEPIDRDMRYMHVAIRKNIQDRYRKKSIMEEYGHIITGVIFLVVMGILVWLLIDKAGGMIEMGASQLEVCKQTMEASKEALSIVDKVCSGGGGYIQT